MEIYLAPHLLQQSKNFLGRNLPNHMNNQKPGETEGRRGCNLLVFVVLLCAAPWLTWPRHALLRVGWVMRSGSRLSNRVMGVRDLLKHPLPSRYRNPQGDDPHGEPDRFFRYRRCCTIYTSIVSYESRRIHHKTNHRDPTTFTLPTSQSSWLADWSYK